MLIATPVSTHYPLGMAALRAGKHVFIEKPLATSTRDAAELATTAAQLGLVIMPGHTFLYSPPVVAIHDLVVSGALGELLFISSSRVNLGLHQSDVSVVWDLAPHDFSILRYWLGETPTHVSATARACVGERPDVAFIDLEYESGPIAHVELSWLAPSKLRRTTIVGSEKMVVYDDTCQRTGSRLRLGREPEGAGDFRRVQAHLSDGRHRLSTDRRCRAARDRVARLLPRHPEGHAATVVECPRCRGGADDGSGRQVPGVDRNACRRRRRHSVGCGCLKQRRSRDQLIR